MFFIVKKGGIMKEFTGTLKKNREWIFNQLLKYATEQGYVKYSSTLKEAWLVSIDNLSESLVNALETSEEPFSMHPDDNFTDDPRMSYGVLQAQKHRERGINLGMFLGLLKYYRQSYIDLICQAGFDGESKKRYRLFVERFFDRMEIAVSIEWNQKDNSAAIKELQTANRNLTNEKNKYLTIFESIPNPVMFFDRQDGITDINHAALELIGVNTTPGSDYYGNVVLPPEFSWLVEKLRVFTVSGEQEFDFEKQLNNGKTNQFLHVKFKKMLDVSDQYKGTVVILEDITHRKQAEEQLFAEKERLSLTLSSIGDAVIAVDNRARITLLNSAAENLTGWKQKEAIGEHLSNIFKIINEYTREPVNNPVDKVFTHGKTVGLANHTNLIKRDGTEISIADSAAPIKDTKDNILGAIMVFRDVTLERKKEEALKESEEFNRAVLASLTAHIAVLDRDGKIIAVNEAWKQFAAANGADASSQVGVGVNYLEVCRQSRGKNSKEAAEVLEGLQSMLNGGQESFILEYSCHSDKEKRWFLLHAAPLRRNAGGIVVSHFDITGRKLAKEELLTAHQQLTDIIEFLPDATFVIDKDKKVIAWNRAIEKMTGVSKNNIIGKGSYEYAIPFYGEAKPILIDMVLEPNTYKHNYDYFQWKDKKLYAETFVPNVYNKKGAFLWVTASPLYDTGGNTVGAIESIRDVSERKRIEEQLRYLSFHDSLTGFYNRNHFEQEMHRLEQGCRRPVGIIICDVDGLKLVNDTLGHNVGDKLLTLAARTIKQCFRKTDIVARIGGDEFAVLLPDSNEKAVEKACQRIRYNIKKYNQNNPELMLSISVGFAASKGRSVNMSDLFKEADNSMYREKLHRSQSVRSATVQILMKALEAKDFITEGHGDRLQDLVVKMGMAVGLPERVISDLKLFAQFHDIGKVGIPDRILFKPGPLTTEEFIEMQRHSEIGCRIAQSSSDLIPIADWILKHHEWWNGQGYPMGLKGEEIPLECRILAIADAYDAMTSDRPYRKALSHGQAIEELVKNAGKQFDRNIMPIVIKILSS